MLAAVVSSAVTTDGMRASRVPMMREREREREYAEKEREGGREGGREKRESGEDKQWAGERKGRTPVGDVAHVAELAGLVHGVLVDDVGLVVLVVAEADEDHVVLVDPHLLAELSADVALPLLAIKALALPTAVAEHLQDLRILCPLSALSSARQ